MVSCIFGIVDLSSLLNYDVLKALLYNYFQPALYQLLIEGLPPDATSTENACLITYEHTQSWPLIVDRSGTVLAWLKCRLNNPVILNYKV